jgi:hypothetical protein
MKTAILIAIALVILSSVPMHSQRASASAHTSAPASVGSQVHPPSAFNLNANRNRVSSAVR